MADRDNITVLRTDRLPNRPTMHPASLVLCDRGEGYDERFVTWIRVEPIDTTPYYIRGHYCATREDAEQDYEDRLAAERRKP